ncbi:MAG: hypothetical protein MJ001_06275, partial [Paludibacteraceae bacterium]|nr:hypothetical protein [Paludibacteraceae bacterium]
MKRYRAIFCGALFLGNVLAVSWKMCNFAASLGEVPLLVIGIITDVALWIKTEGIGSLTSRFLLRRRR